MWKISRSLGKTDNSFEKATLKGPQKILFENTDKALHLAKTYIRNHQMTQSKSHRTIFQK